MECKKSVSNADLLIYILLWLIPELIIAAAPGTITGFSPGAATLRYGGAARILVLDSGRVSHFFGVGPPLRYLRLITLIDHVVEFRQNFMLVVDCLTQPSPFIR